MSSCALPVDYFMLSISLIHLSTIILAKWSATVGTLLRLLCVFSVHFSVYCVCSLLRRFYVFTSPSFLCVQCSLLRLFSSPSVECVLFSVCWVCSLLRLLSVFSFPSVECVLFSVCWVCSLLRLLSVFSSPSVECVHNNTIPLMSYINKSNKLTYVLSIWSQFTVIY